MKPPKQPPPQTTKLLPGGDTLTIVHLPSAVSVPVKKRK